MGVGGGGDPVDSMWDFCAATPGLIHRGVAWTTFLAIILIDSVAFGKK